jgi:hypothetical protein
MSTTLVTCFFDIDREHKGDGRKLEEYLEWIKKTLELNSYMFIVTEKKFEDFFNEHRNHDKTFLKIIDFTDLHYYKYYEKMCEILKMEDYKNNIRHPDRVECKLPEYSIIQYSKFHVLDMAIYENPFNSEYFFWVDAGISRFFIDVDITKPYPGQEMMNLVKIIKDQFFIQSSTSLDFYEINENFIWDSVNLFSGGMFGGSPQIIKIISEKIEEVFQYMLSQNCVNNEQLALAMVWVNHPELFFEIKNTFVQHLPIFKIFAS